MTRSIKRGFTLVEILIVVIILGILAAIVIPQFTNASQDARESSLVSQLQTLRSQVELYKLQHGDALPNLVGGWGDLMNVTVFNGENFGPYLQAIPVNPLNGLDTVTESNGANGATPAAATAACGFVFDQVEGAGRGSGRIWATDTNTTAIFAE